MLIVSIITRFFIYSDLYWQLVRDNGFENAPAKDGFTIFYVDLFIIQEEWGYPLKINYKYDS